MPYVYSPGFKDMVTAMDYNFWVKFNGGKDEPDTAPRTPPDRRADLRLHVRPGL